jgi:hypothetical protein
MEDHGIERGNNLSDLAVMLWPHFERCRTWLEKALRYCHGTHTIEDIWQGIATGQYILWPMQHSAVLFQLVQHPQMKVAYVFLAGGSLKEIEASLPQMEAWAKEMGCSRAEFSGRAGWTRSFLTGHGYQQQAVTVAKEL